MIRKTIIPFILLMCLLTGCEEFANMQKENAIFDVAEHQDMAKSEFAKRYKDYGFRCDLKKGIDYCSFQTPQATIFPDFRGERLIHLYITDITNKPKFDDKGIYFFNLPTYPINQKKSNDYNISYEGNVPGWKNVYIQLKSLKEKVISNAYFSKE